MSQGHAGPNDRPHLQQSGPLFVGSLAKGLSILEIFAGTHRELSIKEASQVTGFERSQVQRLLNTLHVVGYLEKDEKTKRYRLAGRVLDLAFNFQNGHPLVDAARPHLVALGDSVNAGVTCCLHDDLELICVHRIPRRSYMETSGTIEVLNPSAYFGERQPAYCTAAGRSILAFLSDDQARDILERSDRRSITRLTLTNVDEILKTFPEARDLGYARQYGEFLPGELNFAAPVFDRDNTPMATVVVSIIIDQQDVTNELEERISTQLLRATHLISSALQAK
ncbi:IclR family transcriptional regulator [Roseibium sp. SCP14]|uniref:IclR family transcriptional regulator n=1 Tax=Roseibium sp. SCP14 TaxID=3141375 RepID=UPI00333BEDA4